MGKEEFGGDPRVRDHGNGVENYECDGCCMDTTFSSFDCGVCPHNRDRVKEYERKYIW